MTISSARGITGSSRVWRSISCCRCAGVGGFSNKVLDFSARSEHSQADCRSVAVEASSTHKPSCSSQALCVGRIFSNTNCTMPPQHWSNRGVSEVRCWLSSLNGVLSGCWLSKPRACWMAKNSRLPPPIVPCMRCEKTAMCAPFSRGDEPLTAPTLTSTKSSVWLFRRARADQSSMSERLLAQFFAGHEHAFWRGGCINFWMTPIIDQTGSGIIERIEHADAEH